MKLKDRHTVEQILAQGKLHIDRIKPECLPLVNEGIKSGWITRSRAGYLTLKKGC
jgi:hypothetical protein